MEHARPPSELNVEGSAAARAEAWRKWWKQFSVFLKASGVSKEAADVQASLLVNLIGAEGYEIFSTFTYTKDESADDIACIKRKFDDHFGTKVNVTMLRFKFFTRNQNPGETINQYVTALKLLSQGCEFETLEYGLIRDRVVCGISSNVVRDRLLRTDDLTLAKAVQICEAHEMSAEEGRRIEQAQASTSSSGIHGSPIELITDNGPAYSSREFKMFMEKWEITHITSSPLYAQSNGKSERAVRTVKKMIQKCILSGQDYHLGLLNFRSTPRDGLDAPSTILMGRKIRTRLPMYEDSEIKPKHEKNYRTLVNKQQRQKLNYDRSARDLPPLQNKNVVVVADGRKREFMEVVSRAPEPRSYILKDSVGRECRRNRRHIIRRMAQPTPTDNVQGVVGGDVQPSTSAPAADAVPAAPPLPAEGAPEGSAVVPTPQVIVGSDCSKHTGQPKGPITRSKARTIMPTVPEID